MSDLSLYQGGFALSRVESQRTAKAIARGAAALQVQQAGIDNATDATIAKAESSTAVTAHAMMGVTRIAQLQQQLELQTPSASGRLAMLADDHALGQAEVVMDHRRKMRQH